ncbi:MAG TPA: Fe-S cluster assembly ATPase SufC [Microthrixaceae bacterium]|nr:Fe-S cluster assembly ATPase SufC [Microthrixaceae bacterium]
MTELVVSDLCANVGGREILRGVSLTVRSGEVHAVMGPNGSGKSTLSHVLMGRPGYEVTGGSVTLDGVDVLALEPWERAGAGLFLAMQYPTEVPGVAVGDVIAEAFAAQGRDASTVAGRLRDEADRVGLDHDFLDRSLNVDFSGGEKKRNETVQLAVLGPKVAILDEIDSGLDIDALRRVSQRIEDATRSEGLGVLAITHYNRLLEVLHADVVHVFAQGRILESGGPEVATRLEREGYGAFADEAGFAGDDDLESAAATPSMVDDPFAEPF